MQTFKEFMESDRSWAPPSPHDPVYHAAIGQPPRPEVLGQHYAKKLAQWEIVWLTKFIEVIEISDENLAKGKKSPIVKSKDGRCWIPIVIMNDGTIINNTSWHSGVFKKLQEYGTIATQPNQEPVFDPRDGKNYPANSLCEVYPTTVIEILKAEAGGFRFAGASFELGNKIMDKASSSSLKRLPGTDLFGR